MFGSNTTAAEQYEEEIEQIEYWRNIKKMAHKKRQQDQEPLLNSHEE